MPNEVIRAVTGPLDASADALVLTQRLVQREQHLHRRTFWNVTLTPTGYGVYLASQLFNNAHAKFENISKHCLFYQQVTGHGVGWNCARSRSLLSSLPYLITSSTGQVYATNTVSIATRNEISSPGWRFLPVHSARRNRWRSRLPSLPGSRNIRNAGVSCFMTNLATRSSPLSTSVELPIWRLFPSILVKKGSNKRQFQVCDNEDLSPLLSSWERSSISQRPRHVSNG